MFKVSTILYAAVLGVIVIAMLAVSIGRSVRLTSHDDFMVADRNLSGAVLIFTLLCSWIGAGSLFAGAEFAYHQGLASLWLPAGGWVGLMVVYFTAGRARAFAQYTVPDLLEVRYGALARVFGTLCIIVSYTAIVSYQLKGGGRILNLALGISETRGTVLMAIFVIVFTALAGMSSVAYVDLVIGIAVTIGCLVAFPALVNQVGGWRVVHSALPPSHFTVFGTMKWTEAMGYFFPTFTLMLGNQTMYQKFYAAKSERVARHAVVGWIGGTVLLETVIVLIAVTGSVLFRRQLGATDHPLPPWAIIPYAARRGLTPAVGSIFLSAIFAKVISTGNNFLFSPASSVVHDLFQRFVLKGWSDRPLLLLSRLSVIILGLIALAQAFQPSVLATAVYAYDVYGAGLTPAIMAAFLWERATVAGGICSIIAGTTVALAWKIMGYATPMIFPALAASLACLVAVSLATTPSPRKEQCRPVLGRPAAAGK